jgi:PAS domain S-box-containing protein
MRKPRRSLSGPVERSSSHEHSQAEPFFLGATDSTYPKHDNGGNLDVVALKEHLASIVEFSNDAIISKDLNGIIQSWNRGAQRIFGYTPDEVIGKHISVLAPPDRLDEFPNILQRISSGERLDHYQTRRKTKDGRILSISLTVSPIRDATGRIVGASKIARDVTEQERYQAALRQANESLTRSNADLEQFAYSASHDLQEPLRMISTYGEMLQRKFGGQLGRQADEYIGYIVEGATRMERLLRDLRAFTHASRLGEPVTNGVDANGVLTESLANLSAAIQESGALVTHGPLPSVRIHQFQLEQLFQNLVGNAIRYRSERRPEIHVSAERHDNMWQFSVRDNGLGIDSEYQEQIFGLFKRLHSVADYPGTGMGLAICQRIVERAGGRIWVESSRGGGSTFLFTLPAA